MKQAHKHTHTHTQNVFIMYFSQKCTAFTSNISKNLKWLSLIDTGVSMPANIDADIDDHDVIATNTITQPIAQRNIIVQVSLFIVHLFI